MKLILLLSMQAETFLRLVEIIIWPLTLFVIIMMFRGQFRNAMERLGSFKADASGISLSFEPKLDAAKKIFAALQSDDAAKSGVSLKPTNNFTGTPQEQLSQIKAKLHSTLVELAAEAQVATSGKSAAALCKELQQRGVIKNDSGHLIGALLEVIDAAPATISQAQLDEIEKMYNSI